MLIVHKMHKMHNMHQAMTETLVGTRPNYSDGHFSAILDKNSNIQILRDNGSSTDMPISDSTVIPAVSSLFHTIWNQQCAKLC